MVVPTIVGPVVIVPVASQVYLVEDSAQDLSSRTLEDPLSAHQGATDGRIALHHEDDPIHESREQGGISDQKGRWRVDDEVIEV
jgi:hypothetical protein